MSMYLKKYFSCVTAELFLDGQLIFNLSELLDYCQKEFSPEPLLKKITDKNIRVSYYYYYYYYCCCCCCLSRDSHMIENGTSHDSVQSIRQEETRTIPDHV